MTQHDDQMHLLPPRSVLGRMDEREIARFHEHLAQCEECRSEMAFLERVDQLVAAHGAEVFADHPGAELLVEHQAGELSTEEAAAIRKHLDGCANCALEARWIAGDAVYGGPTRTKTSVGGWWRVVAAVAAIALIAVAVPLLRGPAPPAASFARPQAVREVLRGAEAENIVELRVGEAEWEVYLPVDLPEAGFPCTVELLDSSGRQIARTELASRAELVMELYLFLRCDRRTCEPGTYAVHIRPSGNVPEVTLRLEVRDAATSD